MLSSKVRQLETQFHRWVFYPPRQKTTFFRAGGAQGTELSVYLVGQKTWLDGALEAWAFCFRAFLISSKCFLCTAGLSFFADPCKPTGLQLHRFG